MPSPARIAVLTVVVIGAILAVVTLLSSVGILGKPTSVSVIAVEAEEAEKSDGQAILDSTLKENKQSGREKRPLGKWWVAAEDHKSVEKERALNAKGKGSVVYYGQKNNPLFQPGVGIDTPPKVTRAPAQITKDKKSSATPDTSPLAPTKVKPRASTVGGFPAFTPVASAEVETAPILTFPSTAKNYALGPTVRADLNQLDQADLEKDDDGIPPEGLVKPDGSRQMSCAWFKKLPQTFLSFEPWPGGWNNRRLSLECAAALALTLNRTLVLPPDPVNLHDDHVRGARLMGYGQAYNLTAMRYFLPAITYGEFLECGKRSNILDKLKSTPTSCQGTPAGSKDRYYCESQKSTSEKALFPKVSGGHFYTIPEGFHRRDPKGHHRQHHVLPTLGKDEEHLRAATLVHFQRNLLSTFSNMLYIDPKFEDDSVSLRPAGQDSRGRPLTVKQRLFGAMRDGLQYKDEIKKAAAYVVHNFLGGVNGFSAVHLRKTDFKLQYKYMVIDGKTVLKRLAPLFKKGELLFLSSDADHEVVQELQEQGVPSDGKGKEEGEGEKLSASPSAEEVLYSKKLRWVTWTQLLNLFPKGKDQLKNLLGTSNILEVQVPLVIQEIMVAARIFAPNPFSTYSGLVVRQRGYREGKISAIGPYYINVDLPKEWRGRSVGAEIDVVGHEQQEKQNGEQEEDETKSETAFENLPPAHNIPLKDGPTWGHETDDGFTKIRIK